MLDSERIFQFLSPMSWLWVDSKERAKAFLLVFFTIFGLLLLFAIVPLWRPLLQAVSFDDTVSGDLRVASKIAHAEGAAHYRILMLGGSTVREITSDDQMISQALSQKCGQPISFLNGGTSSQSLATAWTFAERLAESRLDVVVIGMNYFRMTFDHARIISSLNETRIPLPRSRMLLFDSLRDNQQLPKVQPLAQIGQLLGQRKHIRQIAGVDWQAGADRKESASASKHQAISFHGVQNRYKEPVFSHQRKVARVSNLISYMGAKYIRSVKGATSSLHHFADALAGKGIETAFFLLPMDPEMDRARKLFDPQFDQAMAQMEQAGHKVIDWRGMKELKASDFYDQQHFIHSGRRKTFDRLINNLSALVPAKYCPAGGR